MAAGGVDRSFSGGFVETPLSPRQARVPGAPNIWDMAPVRGDGFVAAIADLTTEQSVFGVVRYRRNGSLDRRFGEEGFTRPLRLGRVDGQAQAIAVRRDGRIVVAGFWHGYSGNTHPLLAGFRRDGSLDRSFGHDGIVMSRRRPRGLRGGALHDVAIQPGGRIVAVGSAGEHGIGESSRFSAGTVTAYRPDGRLDRGFGDDGQVTFPVRGGAEYTGLKTVRALPDGRLLVAGFHYGSLLVARLLPDGGLDPGFGGGDGKVKMAVNGERGGCSAVCWSSTAIALRPDGRIVVLSSLWPDVPAIVQLRPNGERDWSFGHAGVARARVKRHRLVAFDMTLQRGRVLVAGWDEARRGKAVLSFCAFRYRADGRLDRSFGRHGVWVRRGAEFSGAYAVLNQPRGRAVVAGGSEDRPKARAPYESFLQLTRFLPG
jgi:uncharacterized delta-60 repeat protein